MPPSSFYRALPAFQKFTDFTKEVNYAALPEDWCVALSDIEGSTQAIEAGRYKDVNLVGAATIAAARNALSGEDMPFVFGGDGASFAFEEKHIDAITAAMQGLERMAAENFGLPLRVGIVPVRDLYQAGARLEVARHELIAGRHLAIFRGGGLSLAEKWIKQPDSPYVITPTADSVANIEGLSCRWNAVPNIRGTILSLIVQAHGPTNNAVYDDILQQLSYICGGDLDSVNPVNIPKVSYQSIKECLFQENRLHIPASQDSLMTCYVDDIHDGNHIHFIDGANGGYAMAAKQMKAQMYDNQVN